MQEWITASAAFLSRRRPLLARSSSAREIIDGSDAITFRQSRLRVDRVPPAAHLQAAFAVIGVVHDDVTASLEPMRDAAEVLPIPQPFKTRSRLMSPNIPNYDVMF